MKEISSSHNEIYKHLKKLLTSAKYRRQTRQTVLEGIHLSQSYLQNVGLPIMCIYTDRAKENLEVKAIIEQCERASTETVLISQSKFQSISIVDNGIGILFVITQPKLETAGTIDENALLLEGIQDPGNLGTILRTAAAAGLRKVYVSEGSVGAWSPKVLRSGMGAHFALDIYEQSDLSELIRAANIPVMATSLSAEQSVYTTDLSVPTGWLFGGEGSGVSGELLTLNVQQVIIPQSPKVESLNVAASVAVCLFEQVRQQTH